MKRPPPWLVVVLVGSLIGVVFAAVSTYDFVQHLDRQVHTLHCSFIPGASHGGGESGCQVAMMSPYSSVMRSRVWGGVPIALGALSVFAFLAFFALDLALTRRKHDRHATGFLALATLLPAMTSLVMLTISLSKLGTTCKLCVCIYVASALCLFGAVMLWRSARRGHAVGVATAGQPARLIAVDDAPAASGRFLGAMFAIGVAFVAIPAVLYLAMAPDHAKFIGSCDALPHPDDTYGIMVKMAHGGGHGAPSVEVLDPLCPACRAFEQRLDASGLADELDRKAVMFPLDNTCNWMVTEATHPGACVVSEAVLCAGDKAPDVLAWAFAEQDAIKAAAKSDATAAAKLVKARFPELAACVGSPDARSRLNKSMRWIVANNLRVLTPQVYIDNVKLCDEDVDLGLEYTLRHMLARHADHTLKAVKP
ncbi:MAG TPA: vitamin K epoxide reductase family protein [Kofleriaceae bacterium]|nr:vitamin K epoxide reductase family protein [Kofleriaceae bacterium]